MNSRLQRLFTSAERGQAMVFTAIVFPALLAMTLLALEGGRTLIEYRQLQSAADIGALVGAQMLPCSVTDSTCINKAETKACSYAMLNGATSCTTAQHTTAAGGQIESSVTSGTSAAAVPPISCSPYYQAQNAYGNFYNTACHTQPTPADYYYIEVMLSKQFQFPFYPNPISFTLSTHAVARRLVPTPSGDALLSLDPNVNLTFQSSSLQLNVTGNVQSNDGYTTSNGNPTILACAGAWSQVAPPPVNINLQTDNSSNPTYSPANCGNGAVDSPGVVFPNAPTQANPYGNSVQPSYPLSNCAACNDDGWYYQWKTSRATGTWNQATGSSQINVPSGSYTNVELFPGKYPGGIKFTGGNVYFNPGVYYLGGNMDTSGNPNLMCVYGSPACDQYTFPSSNTCSTYDFTLDTANAANWYYHCSGWGHWDTYLTQMNGNSQITSTQLSTLYPPLPSGAASDLQTIPTFTDGKTPLNGVTFVLGSGAQAKMTGTGAQYLSSPNPCPGTDADGTSSSTTPAVSFPYGDPSIVYDYPTTSTLSAEEQDQALVDTVVNNAQLTSVLYTSSTGQNFSTSYPNEDLTPQGECNNGLTAWSGENTGHLEFLFFATGSNNPIYLAGNGNQNLWGSIYDPGTPGCGNSCQVQINGHANSGSCSKGPPFITGQIIADNMTLSGNGCASIFYTPAGPGLGKGSELVE